MNDVLKSSVELILHLLYGDILSPVAKMVGGALVKVFERGSNLLLPDKLKNASTKELFRHYMDKYKEKLDRIPENKRCMVPTPIGVPAVDKLTYTVDEEIANLYISLLASASDTDTSKQVQPSFVSIVESLSVDEAHIIKFLKKRIDREEFDLAFYSIRGYKTNTSGFRTIADHLTIIPYAVYGLDSCENEGLYLANLVRLGILTIPPRLTLLGSREYDDILKYIGFNQLKAKLVPSEYVSLRCIKGYFSITPFGKSFINAVSRQ